MGTPPPKKKKKSIYYFLSWAVEIKFWECKANIISYNTYKRAFEGMCLLGKVPIQKRFCRVHFRTRKVYRFPMPHNGCHRPHQLHRTHLWQKLHQQIFQDINHSCQLCQNMAACFWHHQPNHLWSFKPQFWQIWAGRCNVRYFENVEGSKPKELVFVFGVITLFLVIFIR